MRQKIVHGEFAPGQRLSEAALSEHLQISRNTLREVFRLLTKEGLLRHEPNRGVSVAVPSIASIIDIYRVRRLIRVSGDGPGLPRNPAIQHMRRAVEAGQTCRDNADWQGVGTANMEFHMAIVELADSERLNTMFAHLLAELRLAFGLLNDPEFLHAPYVEMNVKILELFEAGKLAEAAAALNDYLVHSERIVLAVYARRISDGGQPKVATRHQRAAFGSEPVQRRGRGQAFSAKRRPLRAHRLPRTMLFLWPPAARAPAWPKPCLAYRVARSQLGQRRHMDESSTRLAGLRAAILRGGLCQMVHQRIKTWLHTKVPAVLDTDAGMPSVRRLRTMALMGSVEK